MLHLGIIASMFITWSHRFDIVDQSTPVVPVDLVTVAERTNVAPQVAPQPITPPAVPNMIEPLPQTVEEPKFEVAPADVTPPVKPKPAPKKEPKAESKSDQLDSLLNKLASAKPANARAGSRTIQGQGAQTAMTADLVSILQSQIYRCWSPPMGGPNSESLVVTYEVWLNPDGRVAQPPVLLSAPDSESAYRYAANHAAERAIYACQPYKLPLNRYNEWHSFNFVFDPRSLTGQ
ncbi:MAG: cell envelope integrity protein TolA [Alphaproteobacteria bacterium]|nr:cell envelope integrity protein TolA [Alphaproteobacteria bacterium]